MKKNISKQEHLQSILRQMRVDAQLRQIDLAERLGQPQSYVSKYESGERRLDFIEIHDICQAVGIALVEFVRQYEKPSHETR